MKLKYTAQKNSRINHSFMGITTYNNFMYNHTLKKWEPNITGRFYYGSHQPCKSMKAFRRKLKQAPEGVEFILVGRWVGHDIIGKGTKKNII